MIALLRVDNRLLHGQVLETWVPRLKIRHIVVADDEAAGSPLARAAMTLCLPPEIAADVLPQARVDYPALAAEEHVLVLFREVAGLAQAAASGLTAALAPKVNIGNVHYRPGRRAVTPSVFLAAEEVAAIDGLARAGFDVEARAIPSDAPVGARQLAEKYDAAGERR
jgi:PTS system N-acetylgalactosamine-specific IIB component